MSIYVSICVYMNVNRMFCVSFNPLISVGRAPR